MSEKTENITTEQQNEDAVLGIKTKIVLLKNVDFFGPGLFHLLRYIDEEGTIHAASKKMGMSYSKAWKITKKSEEDVGITMMKKSSGGAGGGHTELTPEGKDFLARYQAFCREAGQAVDEIFKKYFTGF